MEENEKRFNLAIEYLEKMGVDVNSFTEQFTVEALKIASGMIKLEDV